MSRKMNRARVAADFNRKRFSDDEVAGDFFEHKRRNNEEDVEDKLDDILKLLKKILRELDEIEDNLDEEDHGHGAGNNTGGEQNRARRCNCESGAVEECGCKTKRGGKMSKNHTNGCTESVAEVLCTLVGQEVTIYEKSNAIVIGTVTRVIDCSVVQLTNATKFPALGAFPIGEFNYSRLFINICDISEIGVPPATTGVAVQTLREAVEQNRLQSL
ncbi:hypothetical protein ACFOZY_06720 [Chungangia koreensis]|uniref:Uncharacterized protein n=1 Tax=Chungangia koreensis TaxID=752657 RepID=A0ABV8X2H4_9LACT